MNKPLSERMELVADRLTPKATALAIEALREFAAEVRSLEQRVATLERGVEAEVPEGWHVAHIEWRGQARQPTYEADLWCHENGGWVYGTGPTIESAIRDAVGGIGK